MHFEKIIQDLNKELETIKNSIKELLKNSELNSNDIEVSTFFLFILKSLFK